VTTRVVGIFPTKPGVEAWSGGHVSWIHSQCTGGTLSVKVSSDENLFPKAQTLAVSGSTYTIAPGTADRSFTFPLTPQNGVCRVDFAISPTAVPAKVEPGNHDTRRLGLHFTPFVYRP
jgi:hypothetical protein